MNKHAHDPHRVEIDAMSTAIAAAYAARGPLSKRQQFEVAADHYVKNGSLSYASAGNAARITKLIQHAIAQAGAKIAAATLTEGE